MNKIKIKTFYFEGEEHNLEMDLVSRPCAADGCGDIVTIGLPYCPTHTGLFLNLEIRKSLVPDAGTGVFAHCPPLRECKTPVFRPGYYIHPYSGENITDDEVLRRYGSLTAPYVLGTSKAYGHPDCVDAARIRGIMAMVNHPPKGKRPNVQFVGRRKDGGVNVEALRKIYHGEELYVSYGREYFRHLGRHWTL